MAAKTGRAGREELLDDLVNRYEEKGDTPQELAEEYELDGYDDIAIRCECPECGEEGTAG